MNRPFRFRAWDADLSRMMPAVDLSGPVSTYQWLGAYDLPIMQFTGLRDKNGQEIFEGDIVSLDRFDGEHVRVVSYLAPAFYLQKRLNDTVDVDSFSTPLVSETVIGNIYENPDLLAV